MIGDILGKTSQVLLAARLPRNQPRLPRALAGRELELLFVLARGLQHDALRHARDGQFRHFEREVRIRRCTQDQGPRNAGRAFPGVIDAREYEMTVCLDEDQKAGVAGGGKKRLPSLQIRIHHLCLTMPEADNETKLLAATIQC